jgi:hypothetical protein
MGDATAREGESRLSAGLSRRHDEQPVAVSEGLESGRLLSVGGQVLVEVHRGGG